VRCRQTEHDTSLTARPTQHTSLLTTLQCNLHLHCPLAHIFLISWWWISPVWIDVAKAFPTTFTRRAVETQRTHTKVGALLQLVKVKVIQVSRHYAPCTFFLFLFIFFITPTCVTYRLYTIVDSWLFDLLHHYRHQCLGVLRWSTEVLTEGLPLLFGVPFSRWGWQNITEKGARCMLHDRG